MIIRTTAERRDAWRAAADAGGRSLSAWIGVVADEAVVTPEPQPMPDPIAVLAAPQARPGSPLPPRDAKASPSYPRGGVTPISRAATAGRKEKKK